MPQTTSPSTQAKETPRPLHIIAKEISREWSQVNYAAKPYLGAMYGLITMEDKYYADDACSIVTYFLANASSWRGPVARRVKAELNAMLKAARTTR